MNWLHHALNSMTRRTIAGKAPVFGSIFMVFLLCNFTLICEGTTLPGDSTHAKPATSALINNSPVLRLEIHHINVNNGDASVIRLLHKDKTETKVLIDGGQVTPELYLVPYIQNMFKDKKFEYIILSHYHNDHYTGLKALGTGAIRGTYYIDLGGYNMRSIVRPSKLNLIQPRDTTCPWTDSLGVFPGDVGQYIKDIGTAANKYGLKRYMPMSKVNDSISKLIGVVIPLGQFDHNGSSIPIQLRCVAAWGFTQGNGHVVDDWNRGASKNDPSLAFVLECGEFRYFFGGDLGGDSSGSYIDQETTLAAGFQSLYPGAQSYFDPGTVYDGHICGFKADHHGSAHSNNDTFLGQIHAAVCVTSAGSNSGWHLPSVDFIQRLNATTPVTLQSEIPKPTLIEKAQGFFFTNLYNFGAPNNSLDEANKLLKKRKGTAFEYGSINTKLESDGFEVFVELDDPKIDITGKSVFQVVEIWPHYRVSPIIATIHCHQN